MVSTYIRSDALFLSFFKMKLLVANLTLLNALPSVIWHGMGDTANSAGLFNMYNLASFRRRSRY